MAQTPADFSIDREVIALLKVEPFYAHFIQSMRRIVTEAVPTIGVNITDNLNLYINPKFYMSLKPVERVAVLKHEVLHVVNKHIIRGRTLNHALFNIACDVAVNQYITTTTNRHQGQLVMKLPDEALLPQTFGFPENLTAEEYYQLLIKNAKSSKVKQFLEQNGDGTGENQGKDKDSAAGGDQQEDGDKKPKKGLIDDHDIWTKGNMSDEFQHQIVKNTFKKVLERTQDYGNLPDHILSEIKKALHHQTVNWRAILQFFLYKATIINNVPTRKKPNRRFGVYFDGSKIECKLNLAIAIDTSGSIPDEDLELFFSEIERIKALGMKITIIECDAAVGRVYPYKKIPKEVSGRGGTAFEPVFEYVRDKFKPRPDCLIYLTDLYGNLNFKNVARIPTLWAVTINGGDEKAVPFGNSIKLKNDNKK